MFANLSSFLALHWSRGVVFQEGSRAFLSFYPATNPEEAKTARPRVSSFNMGWLDGFGFGSCVLFLASNLRAQALVLAVHKKLQPGPLCLPAR